MTADPPIIAARDLVKTYDRGRVRALDGLDLNVRPGEFVSVVGPSGSGKSTLLHVLGALERPDSGRVLLDGKDLAGQRRLDRVRARFLGFIFQLHNLLPTLTALENVEVPLRALGVGRRVRTRRATALLDSVGMQERLTHRPSELSGGERQRVAVARALVNEPKVILADEPTGDLDRAAGDRVMELIRSLHRERGLTLILVTHDLELAGLAERTVRILDGKVIGGGRRRGDGDAGPHAGDERET
ncbi:MAG: ABC transporter ATP-binding protein [Planctomycetota bacterium]|jgi:putative ABC transport system ATP-binding protein